MRNHANERWQVMTVEIVAYCLQCGATHPTREMTWAGTGWLCEDCIAGKWIEAEEAEHVQGR